MIAGCVEGPSLARLFYVGPIMSLAAEFFLKRWMTDGVAANESGGGIGLLAGGGGDSAASSALVI